MGGVVSHDDELLEPDVRRRAISTLALDRSVEVVDLADRRALSAGVTASVTAGAEYDESHDLASRLYGQIDGVRWRLRHDLAQESIGVALFGLQGSVPDDRIASVTTEPIGRELIRAAEDAFGYRVIPVTAR